MPQAVPAVSFEELAKQAETARNTNQLREAGDLYPRALGLRPQWAEGWWALGTVLYDQEGFSSAAQAFKESTRLAPRNGMGFIMLGFCEYKLGQYDAALAHIEQGQALPLGGDQQFRRVITYHEGVLLLEKGRFEDGQKKLSTLALEGVDSAELKHALGCAVLRLRPSRVQTNDTNNAMLEAAGLAEWHAAHNDLAAASRAYEQLISGFGKRQNVQFAYGRFLLSQRLNEEAIAAFHHEIENTPKHVLARLAIADVTRESDPAASVPLAEEAVKLAPELPTAHYVLGMCFLDTGEVAKAIPQLETAQKELPNQARIYYALSRAYAKAGRNQEAARARERFVQLKGQR